MKRRLCRPLLFAVALALHTASARAEDGDAARLFEESVALMEAGRFADAIPKLEEAQRIEPGTGIQFNLAVCHMKTGRLATALRAFTEVERAARESGKDLRAAAARAKIAELEPIVPRLRVRVEEPGPVELTLDGAPIAAEGSDPLPVDPGAHRIEASAPNKQPFWIDVEAPGEGGTTEVTIPVLAPVPAPATEEPPKPPPLASQPHAPPALGRTQRIVGFGVAGAGVVSLVAAGVSGAMILSDKATADERCAPGPCDIAGRDAVERMQTLLPINAAAWAIAAVGIGLGAYLVLSAPSHAQATKPAAARLDRTGLQIAF